MSNFPAELMRVVEQVVARFVRRYAPPACYDHAEWQAECHGEAWRCVADALRTFDPARGGVAGYVARSVWQHLLDFRARECRWAHRACVSLDAPVEDDEDAEGERAWADPASEEVERVLVERVALGQALEKLSEVDKRLVVWVWLEGVSQAEASGRLGVSQQAVARRLARIRAQLQQDFGGNG